MDREKLQVGPGRSRNQSQNRGRKRLIGNAKSAVIKESGAGDQRCLWSRENRRLGKSR